VYRYDKEWGGDTEASAVCQKIHDPFFEYKKPKKDPIVCNLEDFDHDDLDEY
jgi:transposase